MFILLQNHPGEYRTGAYFTKYPTLPLNEAGRVFRFKEMSWGGSEEDIVNNLECSVQRRTVTTTYDLSWREKSYVLIGNTVWRISSWSSEETGRQWAMPLRTVKRSFTLELMRVDNASEVQI